MYHEQVHSNYPLPCFVVSDVLIKCKETPISITPCYVLSHLVYYLVAKKAAWGLVFCHLLFKLTFLLTESWFCSPANSMITHDQSNTLQFCFNCRRFFCIYFRCSIMLNTMENAFAFSCKYSAFIAFYLCLLSLFIHFHCLIFITWLHSLKKIDFADEPYIATFLIDRHLFLLVCTFHT